MDWTLLQTLMEWLAPAGWLVTAIAWWRDRKVYQVRAVKETEGTYKALYDDLSATVLELSKQLRKQNERNINHETALRKLHTCRYADRCPAIIWMRQQQKGQLGNRPLGQPPNERNRANNLRAVPKRTATCSVSAEQWLNLSKLPAVGLSYRNDGLNIDIQSDGEGDVNVTATADSIGRQVTVKHTETEHRIRDETTSNEVKERRPGLQQWIVGTIIAVLLLFLIWELIKKYLNKNQTL